MIDFKIKVASYVFALHTSYENCKNLCKDYLTDEDSDVDITITPDDIVFEQDKSDKEAIYEGRKPEKFSDGYLEEINVYRKIADYVNKRNANVFHGALIEKDGVGYLFTAKSGTGKTTHINNWLKLYPDTRIINGDKPIIKIDGDKVIAYGTPWSGKENLNINDSVVLKNIIVLERDETNHIEQIDISGAIGSLMSACYRVNNIDALNFVMNVAKRCKLYKLGCNMLEESAKVAYEGMNK